MNAYIKLQYMKNGKFLLPSYFLQMKLNFMINYIFNVNVKEEARENKMNKNRAIFFDFGVFDFQSYHSYAIYMKEREKEKKIGSNISFHVFFIIIRGEWGE